MISCELCEGSEMIDYYNDLTSDYQIEQQFPELVNDFDEMWSDTIDV